MDTLAGRFALVTGGTRGIGRAIVERLLGDGAAVAFCGRSAPALDSAARSFSSLGRSFGIAADVSDSSQVKNLFEAVDHEFGALDILINNAGAGVFAKTGELELDAWRRTLDLNLSGAFYCSREAISRFTKRGGGFIVNMSSLAARNAFSGGAAYNASKFGLNGFTEALMLDHRRDGVRVCSIMPGSVNTEFGGEGDASWKIAPEDVAETVSFVLRMPARTMVSRVEIRPSLPPS